VELLENHVVLCQSAGLVREEVGHAAELFRQGRGPDNSVWYFFVCGQRELPLIMRNA
jgi:hypothetical protein